MLLAAALFAEEPALKIMPLGDSITAGYGVQKAGYREPLQKLLAGRNITADFIGRSTDLSKDMADPEHEGYSGATVRMITTHADAALQKLKPDIILLLAGANDIRVNGPNDQPSDPNHWATTHERYVKLLDTIWQRDPDAVVLAGTILPLTGKWGDREEAAKQYNAHLAELVAREKAAGRKIELVDLRAGFEPADLADGIHPNASGYDKIARSWFAAICGVLDAKN